MASLRLAMATATSVLSLAALKRKLDELSRQIFEIDLKIQALATQKDKQGDIANLNAAKLQLQKDIVDLQIKYQLKKAQNKKK